VRERDGAVDAVELATQIGLHVTTVRFHLDALCDEGVIVRTRVNLPGAGRPRTGYLAVEERLDYRILAELLAVELGQTVEVRARRAQRAGHKWAARVNASTETGADPAGPLRGDDDDDDALDRAALRTTDVFTRMGFAAELADAAHPPTPSSDTNAPTSARERIIRLHACPVRDLARSHPEVGCAVHLGLLQGLLANASGPAGRRKTRHPPLSAHLEPFVEPELCLARLVAG
jgi:predicted ArsR family transcriptional regulator